MVEVEDLYFIANRNPVGNCISWWGQNSQGYTCDIRDAGLYTRTEALSITRGRPEIDKAYREIDIKQRIKIHVDCQDLRGLKPL